MRAKYVEGHWVEVGPRISEGQYAGALNLLPPTSWGLIAQLVNKGSWPASAVEDVKAVRDLLIGLTENENWEEDLKTAQKKRAGS